MKDFDETKYIDNEMLKENGTAEQIDRIAKWRSTEILVEEEERFRDALRAIEQISDALKDAHNCEYLAFALYGIMLELETDFGEWTHRMPQSIHNREIGR